MKPIRDESSFNKEVLRMVDITEISAILAAAGVLVGVVYYMLDIRHQNKVRKTDLTLRIYSMVQTDEFWDAVGKVSSLHVKDYQDYLKQYGLSSPTHRAFNKVCGFYDLLGELLYRKLIDIDMIYDTIGSTYPLTLYEQVKPIILGLRREIEPAALVEFEYLCDELRKKEPQLRKTWSKYLSKSS
jgi:hypothetical protein